jgi:hydrogenase large subunit
MATIKIIDPVTRIEGHLGVEVTIDAGSVVDARCTGTLFRGIETILTGRDPWDAVPITQRICGVCPISHGLAASMALDNAAARTPTANGRILRNLLLGSNFIQSHILHFYLLAALDYLHGPQTAPWLPAWDVDMRVPSSAAILAHITLAIEARRRAHEMGAIIGGRSPSSHAIISGGFTDTPTAAKISDFRAQLTWLTDFIQSTYIPDVQTVGGAYSDYFQVGRGYGNLLAYGVFEQDQDGNDKLLKMGYADNGQAGPSQDVAISDITESVTYSWYNDSTNNLVPSSGQTLPVNPKGNAYSWLKAPRYQGKPCEAGPLARMWVNGDYQQGISVMDRHVARALETLKVAQAMSDWLNQIQLGQPVYDNKAMPVSGEGMGLTEAPRGALGHWVKIAGAKISQYQIITPTCWNASPRDTGGQLGPIEKALVGTPVRDETKPLEVLRVIHSFDPCLSCAVHVMRPGKEPLTLHTRLG